MVTAKQEVREILEKLPDEASLEDIQHHIYVRQKLERALDAVAAGQVLTDEEAEPRFARWLDA